MTEPASPDTTQPALKANPTPVPMPEAKTSAAEPKARTSAVSWLALIVALGAVGVAGLPQMNKPDGGAAQLADIQAALAALEAQPPAAVEPDVPLLMARLATLEAQVAALGTVSETGANTELRDEAARTHAQTLQAEIAALNQRQGELDRKMASRTGESDQRLMLAAAMQLLAAWQSGQGFAAQWQTLVTSAGSNDELSKLLEDAAPAFAAWQEKGIPTAQKLALNFSAAARAEVAAHAPQGQNFGQKIVSKIEGLVTIRRQGETLLADDSTLDAQLHAAEISLAQGDVQSALEKLQLTTQSDALKDWLQGAQARAKADALAQQLVALGSRFVPEAGNEEVGAP